MFTANISHNPKLSSILLSALITLGIAFVGVVNAQAACDAGEGSKYNLDVNQIKQSRVASRTVA